MDQVREVLRYYHHAYRIEQTYCQWIVKFIHFQGGKTHPKDMGTAEIERFLPHLAINRQVSASTQKQVLNAIVFVYNKVLDKPLAGEIAHTRARKKSKTVTVISPDEATLFLIHLDVINLLNP